MTGPHRYTRERQPAPGSSLAQLAQWIPAGSTVLELGPASGYFTRHLHEQLGCTVDAVELDADMAAAARPWCRTLVVGNLATLRLADHFRGGYQRIVVADVIEHLAAPEPVLAQLVALLAPDGELLLSVPNVAYGGLVAALAAGRWDYGDEGLLDRTHLRFYTQASLTALLADAGLHVHAWAAVQRSLYDSEFRLRAEALPEALRAFLAGQPHALVYQWLARAAPRPAAGAAAAAAPLDWSERFPVRLFWAGSGEDFVYARSGVQWAQVGAERQDLEFPLSGAAALRLRLADRPGYVHLHRVAVRDAAGDLLWDWTPAQGAAAFDTADLAWGDADGALLLLGAESGLALRADAACLQRATRLQVVLGWPMSSDYRAAQRGWQAALGSAAQQRREIEAQVATRDAALAQRAEEIGRLEALVAERDGWLAQRHAHIEHLESLVAERERLIAERDTQAAERDAWLAQRQAHIEHLERLVAERDGWLAQRQAHTENLERLVAERDSWLAQRHAHIEHLERLVAERERVIGTRDTQLAERTARIASLEPALAQAQADAAAQADARRSEAATYARELAARNATIAEMRTLRWWALRPLRALAAWLRRRRG